MSLAELAELIKETKRVLPPAGQAVSEGLALAKSTDIGRTAFFRAMGVSSEVEYKLEAMKENRLMVHAHIGLSSWKDTRIALLNLEMAARERNISIDRFGLCLDRIMALPHGCRSKAPSETGPTLDSEEDWIEVAQAVPIQPHMGDFMIGFPAATENTISALKAGITTIGNLSQYFSMQAPGWDDQVTTVTETVKAIAILGALRSRGTLLHSYLEDGFGALFYDCANVAGWAFIEKYIVEDLLGAKLAHCIGGLTSDPVKRAGWVFALKEIHGSDCIGTMFYGDTISFSENFAENRAMIATYLLWDALAQLECPTGHALLPLPVSEAVRVPSADEIIEAQIFGRRIIESARNIAPYFDLRESKQFAAGLVKSGKVVFNNALDGLKEAGADIKDPLGLLFTLKKIGPSTFERLFGLGKEDASFPCGRIPLFETDMFLKTKASGEHELAKLEKRFKQTALTGRKIVMASTDVHEHALFILNQVISCYGAEVINLGAERNPAEIAFEAKHVQPDAIIISTHNGMALEFSRRLKEELNSRDVSCPVYFGGKLNQKIESDDMPIEVGHLIRKKPGFFTCADIGELMDELSSR